MIKIMRNATEEQNKQLNELIDYIINVTRTQGRVLEPKALYGDGTRWSLFHYDGFLKVYSEVVDIIHGINRQKSQKVNMNNTTLIFK